MTAVVPTISNATVTGVVPATATPPVASQAPRGRRGIDQVLAEARSRLDRLSPAGARVAQEGGALLVDIRPDTDRHLEGTIPGAVVIHRNVLEWRLDPSSAARLTCAAYDLPVVVICNEGYTSSLAAASLLDLGVLRATDLVGGYRAWRAAGLPVIETDAAAGP